MNMENVRRYAALKVQLDDLGDKQKLLKAEMDGLEEPLLKDFDDEQIPSVPVDMGGGVRVTVHRHSIMVTKYQDGKTNDDLCAALKRAQLGDLVGESANMNRVGAWMRDRLAEGKPLPPTIADVIKPYEVRSMRATRSNKAETASDAAKATVERGAKRRSSSKSAATEAHTE